MECFLASDFSSYVEELMRQNHVPGLALAVVQNDQVASAGYGKASIDPPAPCTADTIFDLASCSKSFTAASIALLVDDEAYPEIQYDATMSSLLPDDFVMASAEYTEGVTVEDILSHRSGMAPHDNSYMGVRAAQPDTARSITRNLRNLPVAAPLRAKYRYCNMMYTVATHLIEVKTKKRFSDFLYQRLFGPLDMQLTSLQPESARANGHGDRIATGHCWDKELDTYHGFQSPDCPEAQGAGSVMSSASDFVKWVKALMNREGPINERIYQGLIRMRAIRNPAARRLKPHTSPALYAAGLEVYFYRGYMVVGHFGVTAGFASRFFFLPDFNFGAVILGNADGAGPVGTILARELIDTVLKVPEIERPRRKTSTNAKNKTPGQPKDAGKKNQAKSKAKTQKPGIPQPQAMLLSNYIGIYRHPGYHKLTVEVKDEKLFINATDRSFGFTLLFEHLSEGAKYTAHLSDFLEGGDDPVEAEFVIDEGRVVRLGLHLEPALREMIWFDKRLEGDRPSPDRINPNDVEEYLSVGPRIRL
ncbi:putative D-aminopeptidase [Aspergillus steynii IBT 23096]|uniref:Putative D-aminopeptidase n=1 Tax=Aspergillus steynii IBT 23096 TaxID=1392250 RepID=A0A2I2G5V1_9EURO|nr:putative D-aminopeptidase [Aspergillus steynii IBT 23096]PLB48255.1 putative D-aminopeptidase [Aspergillus steynii IBT 23096]